MNKSHFNRFFHRNLINPSTINPSTINHLPNIIRCKKCNKYNYIDLKIKAIGCIFCNNPILIK